MTTPENHNLNNEPAPIADGEADRASRLALDHVTDFEAAIRRVL